MQFLYQFGRWVDAYMMGELKMRDVMDYYYYIQNPAITNERRFIEELLEKAGLTEFAKQLNILASLWFGQGGEVDTGTVFQLEEYIFQKEWKIGGLIQKSFLMKRLVSIFIRETEMKNG